MGESCPQTRESREESRKKSVAFIRVTKKFSWLNFRNLFSWLQHGSHPHFRPLVEENEKVNDENDTSANTVENAEISTKNVVFEGPDEKTKVQTIDPTEIKKLNNETESDSDDSEESEYETDSQVKVQ